MTLFRSPALLSFDFHRTCPLRWSGSHGIISVRMKPAAVARREVLVLAVFLGDHSLCHGEQRFRFLRFRRLQRGVTNLVIRIVLEGNGGTRRIEAERVFTNVTHCRIVADERPIAAGYGEVLLLHAEAHIDAMGDAMAVGEN